MSEMIMVMKEYVRVVDWNVYPTERSCDWLKKVSSYWGGCTPHIGYNPSPYDLDKEGNMINFPPGFQIGACDGILEETFQYCPGCGGKFEIVNG